MYDRLRKNIGEKVEKLADRLVDRRVRKLSKQTRPRMDALHSDDGWIDGNFNVVCHSDEYTIVVESVENGFGSVYVVGPDNRKTREWSIPSDELEDGVESASFALFESVY